MKDIMEVLVGFAQLKLSRFESIMKITLMLSVAGVDISKVMQLLPIITQVYDGLLNGQAPSGEMIAKIESLGKPEKGKRVYTEEETRRYNERMARRQQSQSQTQETTPEPNTTVDNK